MQEASQQRVAAFKAAAHLSQPISIHKGRKMANLNASSRNVDMSLRATSAAAGHARSALYDTHTDHFACRLADLCMPDFGFGSCKYSLAFIFGKTYLLLLSHLKHSNLAQTTLNSTYTHQPRPTCIITAHSDIHMCSLSNMM